MTALKLSPQPRFSQHGAEVQRFGTLAERVRTLGGIAAGDPRHALQVWFLSAHLVDIPLVGA